MLKSFVFSFFAGAFDFNISVRKYLFFHKVFYSRDCSKIYDGLRLKEFTERESLPNMSTYRLLESNKFLLRMKNMNSA